MLYVGDETDVVFSICFVRRGAVIMYGKCECFVMQMLYACVLCTFCGSPSVHLDVPSIGFVCVCRKLSPHLGV